MVWFTFYDWTFTRKKQGSFAQRTDHSISRVFGLNRNHCLEVIITSIWQHLVIFN
ncbi:hypothetical protein XCR1_2860001 [Xenorhabdus cabanillasii JM26]|uniref:Uncharacterized protein n=1 Tax=Xenorhabdus cabanillasii JM26 TaxID=1427517 RepID=W1J8L4_9GAMM|nr:hypothetical protein XCR1_2860001 [Xenorhabdus cabanillasii JM26]